MVVPQVESTLKDLCGGHLKCAVLFGVEVTEMVSSLSLRFLILLIARDRHMCVLNRLL